MMKTITDIWNWRRGAANAAPVTEYTGPVKRIRPSRNVQATIRLPEGVAFKDFVNGSAKSSLKDKVEAAAGWPPGSMVCSQNYDDASLVNVTLSDPRILKRPVLWEGPSWTDGASIADSISIGMYQDGTECEVEVPATQIQVMGQVGSGKSLGGAWNALSEMITRYDCIVWGIDIKKGLQTLGPLVPGLHRTATTPSEAIDILRDANNLITPRTNYLSSDGLGKWSRNCGINYLVVWIEEAPYVMDELGSKGKKIWVETVKAARSAGITIAWSLQRAGFTEISTIARGQATKWCFGVQDSREAKFGLSEVQKSMGCTPEMWGQRQPGMSYIDAPNISEAKVGTQLRAWWWGKNDSLIKAHSERYLASSRPYDDLMEEYFEAKAKGEVTVDKFLSGMKPVKKTVIDVKVTDDSDGEGAKRPSPPVAPKMSRAAKSERGKRIFDAWFDAHRGQTVRIADLKQVWLDAEFKRGWAYARLDEKVDEGLALKTGEGQNMRWEIKPK